jgi:hypothetical protein
MLPQDVDQRASHHCQDQHRCQRYKQPARQAIASRRLRTMC